MIDLKGTAARPRPLLKAEIVERIVLQAGCPIRYLVYKETGNDPGFLPPRTRAEFSERYLVKYWGMKEKPLKKAFDACKTPEARQDLVKRMAKVVADLQPFIKRNPTLRVR